LIKCKTWTAVNKRLSEMTTATKMVTSANDCHVFSSSEYDSVDSGVWVVATVIDS